MPDVAVPSFDATGDTLRDEPITPIREDVPLIGRVGRSRSFELTAALLSRPTVEALYERG